MQRLNKFIHIPSADRRLLINSALLVGTIRLGLWLLPFRILRRFLAVLSKKSGEIDKSDPTVTGRVAWAVKLSSRYIPNATCLSQALAAKVLLSRRGQRANLRIGVARSATGEFLAHAWVESNGKVVIGGSDLTLRHYTSQLPLGEEII